MRKSKFIYLTLALLTAVSWADDAPPVKKRKLTLQDLLKATSHSPSKRSATVAGVRGLEETGGTIDTKARDFPAIERLDKVVIHEDDLKKFIEEGKLR